MKIMIDDVVRDATPEEITQHEKNKLALDSVTTQAVLTKEELFSQMQSLQTQMQMLQAQIANLEK